MATLMDLMVNIKGDASSALKAFRDVEKESKSSSEKVKKTLATVASVGGAAVGTALTASVVESFSREQLGSKLNAQLAATPVEAERFGKVAGDLYAGAWGESIGDVNNAIKSVTQNIGGMRGASEEDLSKVTASVVDLSTAFEQDLGATTQAVGDLMKTGLAANATEALDIIAAGFSNGADKRGDYLDTITEYGVQFQKLGIDGKVATGLLSQGLQAGARDSDFLADALKEFSVLAIDGSTKSAEAYAALGLDAQKMTAQIAAGGPQAAAGLQTVLDRLRAMQDPVTKASTATALFGAKAEDLGASLYALDPSTAVAGLGEVAGAAQKVGDTLNDNTNTQLESWKRSFEQKGQDVVKALGPVGTAGALAVSFAPGAIQMAGGLGQVATAMRGIGFASFLTGLASTATGFVSSTAFAVRYYTVVAAGAARSAAANVAAGAVTVGSLVAQRAAMVASVATMAVVRGATLVWTATQWLLNAALTANPIGIIVVAIGALVAGIIWAYNNVEWFRNLVQGLGRVFKAIWDGIVTGAKWVFNTILVPYFKLWWGIVSGIFTKLWGFIKDFPGKVGSVFKGLVNILTFPFRTAFNLISKLWNSTVGKLSFSLPSWVPGLGGKGFSMPQMPELQGLATGTDFVQQGGFFNLHADETVFLPVGSAVGAKGSPNAAAARGAAAAPTIIVNVAGDADAPKVKAAFEEMWAAKERQARMNNLQAVGI